MKSPFKSSATLTVATMVIAALLPAQAPSRGPAGAYWAPKTKGGIYTPPNKPLTKLADLKAKHAGQTNWTEVVVKDSEIQAEYNSAAAGTKFGKRLRPDTGTIMVVIAGDMRFDIEGQTPIAATRGSIVNILRSTVFSYEVKGDKPALWVELNPLDYQTIFPADGPQPPAPEDGEVVKIFFPRQAPAYLGLNIPHWNLFEAAKLGPPSGYRSVQDHLFANPIWGYADPNDPENPAKGNPAGNRRRAAPGGPVDPKAAFGHMHTGPAEFWIVQSGQVTGRFENIGDLLAGEGDLLYAAPMTWHQMGFSGPGLSCRLALGAYDFINMQSSQGPQ